MVRVVGTDPGTSSLDLVLLEDGGVVDQHRFRPDEAAPGSRGACRTTARLVSRFTHCRSIRIRAAAGVREQPDGRPYRPDVTDPTRPARGAVGRGRISFLRSGIRANGLAGRLPTRRVSPADDPAASQGQRGGPGHCRQGRRRGPRPLVRCPGTRRIRSCHVRRRRDRLGLHGHPDRARRPAGRHGSRHEWSHRAQVLRFLGRRGRLLAVSADQARPVSRRPGRPGPARSGRVSRIADEAPRRLTSRHSLSEDLPVGRGNGIARISPGSHARPCAPFGQLLPLPSLPGAWVKHAAQGSALLADALAGGTFAAVAESLELRSATGSIWDAFNRFMNE